MDIFLLFIALLFMLLGIIGSFLPILPGPLTSWFGLLILHLTDALPMNWTFLGIWLAVAILIWLLDYFIPAIGTKKFGGSKYGMIGTTVGLLVGLFSPIPFGIIIGAFIGAFIGELINKNDKDVALKAAFGSFLGFITSTFLKFIFAIIYLGLFFMKVWEFKSNLF